MKRAACLVAFGSILGLSSVAEAHESRPLYIEIAETEPLLFSIQWKTPPSVPSPVGKMGGVSSGTS